MRYMMFVATDAVPDADKEKPGEIDEWFAETGARWVIGERLRPARDAKTIRVRDGKAVVTDGPFTQSREVIVGFDILECESIDEAIAIAMKHPMARAGRLELRPFWPFEG